MNHSACFVSYFCIFYNQVCDCFIFQKSNDNQIAAYTHHVITKNEKTKNVKPNSTDIEGNKWTNQINQKQESKEVTEEVNGSDHEQKTNNKKKTCSYYEVYETFRPVQQR